MLITHATIDTYFEQQVSPPAGTVFSKAGFELLADWSVRQEWWGAFVRKYELSPDWRESSYMNDANVFAISVYTFLFQM